MKPKKPCDNCMVAMVESATYSEVTCYKTCKYWKEWQRRRTAKL